MSTYLYPSEKARIASAQLTGTEHHLPMWLRAKWLAAERERMEAKLDEILRRRGGR